MGRSNDRTTRGRRRLLAALAFPALGLLVAASFLIAADRNPSVRSAAQLERVLPTPSASAITQSPSQNARAFSRLNRQTHRKNSSRRTLGPVPLHMPIPVKIVIPAIGVAAPVIPLGLNADRTLRVPERFSVAGWFRPGPEPGERGPAVIVGHVDSKSGPGVFYHLRALRHGDLIKVLLRDGSTVRFAVHSSLAAPKDNFPTRLVYGRTKRPTLRLITCDGVFNTSTGHYLDNYIVFAQLAEPHSHR